MSARSDEDRELPWERRGAMRLDCEPHRGGLVRLLGAAGLALGALASCGGVTGLIGLPMGLTAWLMARDDLARMRAGVMDRRGERLTRQGADTGFVGAVLSLFFVACYALLALDRMLPPPYGTHQ
jgi:hypothetical protein